MTPHPAAVAALRVAACPWDWLHVDGGPAVCVPAASKEHPCSSGPDGAEIEAQRLNGRSGQ